MSPRNCTIKHNERAIYSNKMGKWIYCHCIKLVNLSFKCMEMCTISLHASKMVSLFPKLLNFKGHHFRKGECRSPLLLTTYIYNQSELFYLVNSQRLNLNQISHYFRHKQINFCYKNDWCLLRSWTITFRKIEMSEIFGYIISGLVWNFWWEFQCEKLLGWNMLRVLLCFPVVRTC